MEWEKREKALTTGEIEVTDAMVDNYEKLGALVNEETNFYA